MIMNFFTQQVGQQLVQQQILLAEAGRLGIGATNEDVAAYLHSGPTGAVIFPNGKYIGDDQYAALVNNRLNISVAEFEDNIKRDIVLQRLRALITAVVTVNDQEIRSTYRKDNIKIKFDYAVLSSDELGKTINPSDADLQAFFSKNAVRYPKAVPEQRKITYITFTPEQLPGGHPQPSQQESSRTTPLTRPSTRLRNSDVASHPDQLPPNADRQDRPALPKPRPKTSSKQIQSGGNCRSGQEELGRPR
jgi:peptidyl-prolyl cis-trans isomerase D